MSKPSIFLIALLGLALMLWPGSVQAQEAIKLKEAAIELWPEYDRPEVLVIYRVELADDTIFPAQVTLHFPAHIKQMNAIATEQNGGLFNLPEEAVQFSPDENGTTLTLTVESPLIHLEYYDPQLLRIDGQSRQMDYLFTTAYSIKKATVQLQQPLQAEDFILSPQPGRQFTDANGLRYHTIETAGLAPGDSLRVQAGYSRPTNTPSKQLIDEQSAEVKVVTTAPATPSTIPWGYIFVGAGLLLLLATGGYWWWFIRRPGANNDPVPRPARPALPPVKSPPQPPAAKSIGSAGYCHQCGTALRPEAKFCHVCGAPRRQG